MDGCVWRMLFFDFFWARTMLSLADCLEAIKELDRMIVAFLRTPLESASASQWEYTKWPPQSDESYVMCAFQCRVHVLGQLFRLESPRWLCVFLLLWSWGSLWSMLVRSMDGCVWRMFFLISFGLVQRWVWLTAWKQYKSLTGWLSLFLGHFWRVLLHLSENIQSDRPSLTRATWCVLSNAVCMCWDSYFD